MDILALAISAIALGLSFKVISIEDKRDYDINKTNLESVYFNEIYKELLIKSIPSARKYIRFDSGGMLQDIEKMVDVLNQIRNDSLYYYYNNPEFYTRIKVECQNLEDYLIESSSKSLIGEDQTEFYIKLQDELKVIYKVVNNKLLGEK